MTKLKTIYCTFIPTENVNEYRCSNKGCDKPTITTSVLPIWRTCVRTRQQIPKIVSDPYLWEPKPGERDTLREPCKHLGTKTKEIAKCGCHIPDWQKEIYTCPIKEECVLIKARAGKHIKQTNCQECDSYEKDLIQLT